MRIGLPGVTSICSSRKSKKRLYHSADAQGSSVWGGVESSVKTELRGANRTSGRTGPENAALRSKYKVGSY